jgi:hypothetical protein
MKTTLTTSAAAEILANDENASFSRLGAYALVQYLEQMEEDCGEIEFCQVAIRCDYSEYASLTEWAEDYFAGDNWREQVGADMEEISETLADADKLEAAGEIADANQTREHANGILDSAIKEYIQDRGQLIEFSGGIIVSSF